LQPVWHVSQKICIVSVNATLMGGTTDQIFRIEGVHEPSSLADFHEVADEPALDRESDVI
jgi:hypothetical protein